MTEQATSRSWIGGGIALLLPPLAAAGLLYATSRHHAWNEPFFIYSAYYALFALLAICAWIRLSAPRTTGPVEWMKDNAAGLATAAALGAIVVRSVAPGYRVLADEANLVGVSKNLFFHRTANFAVTGKWYFENYWNLDEVADRRPALFPFLVSLVHAVRGYHAENAFYLNAILFVLFVLGSYRLAKSLGGEAFGLAAAVLVAVSPSTLVSVRSAGFDFFATFLLLVIVQSFYDYVKEPAPRALAILTLNLCLLAHVRYEGGALLGVTAVVLLAFRIIRRAHLRGFGFVYSLVPLFLLPRYWQAVAKANDSEQPLSTKLFGISHFFHNSGEYVALVTRPFNVGDAHPPILVILGTAGWVLLLIHFVREAFARRLPARYLHLGVFVAVIFATESLLCFSYFEGEPAQAASARLFIWLDTFMAFAAAWLVAIIGRRLASGRTSPGRWSGAPFAAIASAVLFVMYLPAAIEARFVNALILTRQAAQTWRFFESLGDKRILVVTDRPGLYSIMDYGAVDISGVDSDRSALFELSRHLYNNVYVIQEVSLETGKPLPGFAVWPDVEKETVLEFQTTDTASTRIARVKR